jgi:DNA-binding MarR family transcriptional regulator
MNEPTVTRSARLDEIAEGLPQRAAAISRLFLAHSSIKVSRTEAGVLSALSERPWRTTELAAREGVTQPAITLLVKRLEARGWVSREPDPRDARANLISLTSAGSTALARLRAEYRALLHEEMATLADRDVETLAHATEVLDKLIDKLGRRG